MKMILMVLLVVLTSSVCGMNVTFYQAEEDDDITIRWDIHTKTDMSLTIMDCFLLSKPEKCLYRMVNGIEVPESQHQQFAGRVQCDKDALRDGRIRLLLSRLRTDDSGHYWCDLATNYNKIKGRWGLLTTEQFVLNVTSRGEKIITPGSTEEPKSVTTEMPLQPTSPQSADPRKDTDVKGVSRRNRLITGVCVGVFSTILLAVGAAVCWRRKRLKQENKKEPVVGALLKGHVSSC